MAVLRTTTGLCATCLRHLDAAVVADTEGVWLERTCPDHGLQRGLLARDRAWWERVTAASTSLVPPRTTRPATQGCPFDCGPCTRHEQRVHLPIVPITSGCDLDCPICYTHNRNAGAWHLSLPALKSLLAHLRAEAPERRLLNLTGGEPTQHPQLVEILEACRAEGITRVTLSTHGLRFLRDEALLLAVARTRTRVVLSFDALDDVGNQELLGGRFTRNKLRVLELLGRHGIDTTLLPVVARGTNDHQLGDLLRLTLDHDHVRSLELHPMTFTGQSGASFRRSARITPDEVLSLLEAQSGGLVRSDDFLPSPLAHPLCYQVVYLLRTDVGFVPLSRVLPAALMRRMLALGLYLTPGPELEGVLQEAILEVWSGGRDLREPVLAALRGLVDALFADDAATDADARLADVERRIKAVYQHTHMDEETFDTDRIRQCPVGIREEDGTNVPSCAYNVLYRARDPRFQVAPLPPVSSLGPGREP
jgi:uncharacterized radical SAM superfamily Fe-S cluster-containing enzyme